jgi:ferredoxin
VVFVCQRLHNVVTQDSQATVLVLSLSQLIELVHQCRGEDCSLGKGVVLGKGIQESQSVTIAKFVFVNLNLVAKVNQGGNLQVC